MEDLWLLILTVNELLSPVVVDVREERDSQLLGHFGHRGLGSLRGSRSIQILVEACKIKSSSDHASLFDCRSSPAGSRLPRDLSPHLPGKVNIGSERAICFRHEEP